MKIDDILILVHQTWSGSATAQVRLCDLHRIHWFQPPRAPRPLLHGYISCDVLVTGELSHDCIRDDAPHQLLVCVLKKHNVPLGFVELARRADAHANLATGSEWASITRHAMMPFRTV